MPRRLIVIGAKTFRITIPDDAKVTFGPWSPPSAGQKYTNDRELIGTLRVYKGGTKSTENILAVFSGVREFREDSLLYEEQVAKEEGATIWKSDQHGYSREEKVNRSASWQVPQIAEASDEDEDED